MSQICLETIPNFPKIILNELQYDSPTLYSCILLNRYWCRMAIPILWKNPYSLKGFSSLKLYNMIITLLPTTSKKLLSDNIPELQLPLSKISEKPLFNYISFFSQISTNLIDDMVNKLINKEVEHNNRFKEEYKKHLLEQEIYKLFINNCKNLSFFNLVTSCLLFEYQGVTTCFSQLCILKIDLIYIKSGEILFDMARVCQNIEYLDIKYLGYHEYNINGLISFIDIQRNLQSLCLDFAIDDDHLTLYRLKRNLCQLSNIIEKKAVTIKKFIASSFIKLLSPKILQSLTNLQYLEIINGYDYGIKSNDYEVKEWDKYLSIASFPNLQYLKTSDLLSLKDYMLIEKSHGNLLEINISRGYFREQVHNPAYSQKLIIAISKYCPKIKRLTINIEPENLGDLKEMFLNCTQLKMIGLLLDSEENNCDKLLEVLSDYSPETLCEFSFVEISIFTIEGLENFFESWRKRKPLIFNSIYSCEEEKNFKEYKEVIKKYLDEGVIKESNCFNFVN